MKIQAALQHYFRLALRGYYYRVPILFGLLVVLLSYSPFSPLKGLTKGVFDIQTFPSQFLVAMFASLLLWALRLNTRLLNIYGPRRFHFEHRGLEQAHTGNAIQSERQQSLKSTILWNSMMILPLVVAAWFSCGGDSGHLDMKAVVQITSLFALGYITGTIIYLLAIVVAGGILESESADQVLVVPLPWALDAPFLRPLKRRILSQIEGPAGSLWEGKRDGPLKTVGQRAQAGIIDKFLAFLVRRIRSLPKGLQGGYLQEANPTSLEPGHLTAAAFCTLCSLTLLFVGLFPQLQWVPQPLGNVSPLVSIFAALLAGALFLGGIAFFLDRIPFPLSWFIACWIGLMSLFPPTSSTITTLPIAAPHRPLPYGSDLLEDEDCVLLVTAQGGGIHAGAWAAHVLTSYAADPKTRPIFDHLRGVSAVSGGSYGLMYFLHRMRGSTNESLADAKVREAILQDATASSLSPAIHGLVFGDLVSAFLPITLAPERGIAMESAWASRLPGSEHLSLADWLPAEKKVGVMFNATGVTSGCPFIFASTRMNKESGEAAYWVPFAEVGGTSYSIPAASRASSSFPWVSPAARVRNEGGEQHVVDGGYYDNYGISVLSRWLQGALAHLSADGTASRLPKRILLLQIRLDAADYHPTDSWELDNPTLRTPKRMRDGTLPQISAPITTLLNVRKAGQMRHGADEWQILTDYWNHRVPELRAATAKSGNSAPVDSPAFITTATITYRGAFPLSWHLLPHEKEAILAVPVQKKFPDATQLIESFAAECQN